MLTKIKKRIILAVICTLFVSGSLLSTVAAQAQTGNQPPVADANGPYSGEATVDITFDGSASFDPDGELKDWTWDFGDGDTNKGPTVIHSYNFDGTFNVTLTVKDDDDVEASVLTTATIGTGGSPPVADAGGPYEATPGTTISFVDSESFDLETGIVMYTWDYGVGTSPESFNQPNSAFHLYSESNVYTVKLTVTDSTGDSGSDETRVTIAVGNQAPTADPGGPYTGKVGDPITFDGTGSSDPDGSIVSYEWDFDSGTGTSTGSGEKPTHEYTEAGTYTVLLFVTDDDGVEDDFYTMATVDVPTPPVANAGGPYIAETGDEIQFDGTGSIDLDGSIVSYEWDFGDDSDPVSGPTPIYAYSEPDTYDVTLTVTDDDGKQTPDVTSASINDNQPQPPVADAGGPYEATAGEEIPFDGKGSSDADGTIVAYEWDFDDGSSPVSGETPIHTYSADGVYDVTLTVTDDTGLMDPDVTTASIGDNQPPQPVADAGGPYPGVAREPVFFDGTGSSDPGGSLLRYDWDFGDGGSASDVDLTNPLHEYTVPGTYTVALTVTNQAGVGESDSNETTAEIAAPQRPVADAGGPYEGAVNVPIPFDGTGSSYADGSIVAYSWDFGDGNFGSGQTTSHPYNIGDRTYIVTLTVTADNDAKDLTATKVVIGSGNLPPVADAGGPYTGTVGEEIPFDGSGSRDLDGSIVAYSWDFGDTSSPNTEETPSHAYSEAGVYYATLTVTDDAGLNTSESTEAYIGLDALPPLADAGGPYPGRVDDEITFNGSGSRDLDGSIVSYIWSFGDGTIGTGEEAIHIYSESGPHPVTLWVIDDSNEWNSDGTVALIGSGNLPPVANAGGPYEGAVGEEITFNGSDSIDLDGNIVSYEWSFGDGNFGSGKTPRHAYSADDVYYVTLTVIDDTGAVDSSGTTAAAADADVFLTRLRVPRGLSFRTGRTQYRLIIVKGDGNTIAQNTAVTLSVMSAPGVTVNVNPTEISKVVSPHDDRPTGYPSIAEITCDAPGSYTLRWTATISAAQNSDPDNDTLTKTTRVSCNGL